MRKGRMAKNVGHYRVFHASWGWCAAARTGAGVFAFVLPLESREAAENAVRRSVPVATNLPSGMERLVLKVHAYFDGEKVAFEDALDLSAGTDFQRMVWEQAALVPYGQVATYSGLAREIGRPHSARAVAGALARNPVPLLVPCHRVVGADGSLCGFSAPGGVDTKRAMLCLEGARL